MYWQKYLAEENKTTLDQQLKSAGLILKVFPQTKEFDFVLEQLEEGMTAFLEQCALFEMHLVPTAARYLFEEWSRHNHFIVSGNAHDLQTEFKQHLERQQAMEAFPNCP